VNFEVIGEISEIDTIARGSGVRIRAALRKSYGPGRWRKLKGVADVRLENGMVRRAEVHWFEGHGVGKRKMRIKRFLD